jgi:hypothetical protein
MSDRPFLKRENQHHHGCRKKSRQAKDRSAECKDQKKKFPILITITHQVVMVPMMITRHSQNLPLSLKIHQLPLITLQVTRIPLHSQTKNQEPSNPDENSTPGDAEAELDCPTDHEVIGLICQEESDALAFQSTEGPFSLEMRV